ncbi:MAG: hypothetical protein JXB49_24730, partial [Bacteroidales bacterium]|nr:hypothetical protein [Bacteroidales bacterium]
MILVQVSNAKEGQVPFPIVNNKAINFSKTVFDKADPGPYHIFYDNKGEVAVYYFTFLLGDRQCPIENEIRKEVEEGKLHLDQAIKLGNKEMINQVRRKIIGENIYGTVVVSGTYDKGPVIKYFAALGPQYYLEDSAKEVAIKALGTVNVRLSKYIYHSPFEIWFEFSSDNRKIFVSLYTLKAFQEKDILSKNPLKVDQALLNKIEIDWLNEQYYEEPNLFFNQFRISGVPYYDWSYGCSPTASAMALGYWDAHGFSMLVDYYFDRWDNIENEWDFDIPNVQKQLAIAMGTDTVTTGGTTVNDIASGTQAVCNDLNWGNHYNFTCENIGDDHTRLISEIDAKRPTHWVLIGHPDYGEHSVCAMGWGPPDNNYIRIHDTWTQIDETIHYNNWGGSRHVITIRPSIEVGGEITSDRTWTIANSPYLVTSDITVRNHATLTIEAGVVILFNPGTGLRIGSTGLGREGSLSAVGTATNPVIFTSISGNSSGWKGIIFDDGSDLSGHSSAMSYCVVENAGQVNAYGITANIHCRYTNTPAISNSTVQNSGGYEIYCDQSSPSITNSIINANSLIQAIYLVSGSSPSITVNSINGNNNSYWLYCADNNCNPTLSGNTFSGNVNKSLRLGTHFQMSGNTFLGATNKGFEIFGGDLTSDRNWSKQTGDSSYVIVHNDLVVREHAVLTIESGVMLKFMAGTGLRVGGTGLGREGSLSAVGSETNPIIFTSSSGTSGGWKGIVFDDGSDLSGHSSSLSYCTIENAGQVNSYGVGANIFCRYTNTPAISNCTIQNSNQYEFYMDNSSPSLTGTIINANSTVQVLYLVGGSSPSLTQNSINGNGNSYWLYCADRNCNPIINNNTFTGPVNKSLRIGTHFQMSDNGFSDAVIKGLEVYGGEMTINNIWSKQLGDNSYVIINNDLIVRNHAVLTIEPGVILKFIAGTGLRVGSTGLGREGSISAVGTEINPIIFTSSSGSSGGWKGIVFDDGSDLSGHSSLLNFCIIENAGIANYYNVSTNLHCRYTNTPVVSNNQIINGSGYGIYIEYASPTITNTKIINNSNYGIYCGIAAKPLLGDNTNSTNDLFGNGGYDVYIVGSENINARYNYWGTTNEAQIKARIYDKYDNPNSGEVFYSPWATQSGGANQPPTAFSLFSPLNNSVLKTLTPTLTWQKSDDVDGSTEPIYTVQIGTDSSFASNYYEFYNIKQESYTLSQPLTDKTKYFWRVKATDEKNASTWSNEVWNFTIDLSAQNNSPSTPTVLIPINGEEAIPSDYLVWTKSTDPDVGDVITYTLELDNNANFSSPEIRQSGVSGDKMNNEAILERLAQDFATEAANAVYIRINTLQNYANLKDDSTYFWRVKAVDNYGYESDFTSGTSHFFFNKTNTAPQPVIAGFSPKDGLEVRTNKPEISWHPAKDADLSDHAGTL